MRLRGLAAFLLSLSVVNVSACGRAEDALKGDTSLRAHQFHSKALNRPMSYIVLRPRGEAVEGVRFPVLYLLHGHGGSHLDWTEHDRLTELSKLVEEFKVLIVAPDGGNSWYVNGANGERWEDYIADDLPAEIEGRFAVLTTREGRAMAGFSMGGYGALKTALKRPARYQFAGGLSGAVDTPRVPSVFGDVTEVFGPPGSEIRRANDLWQLVASVDAARAPFLYLDCGTDDEWSGVNRELASAIKTRGLKHLFHEQPGGHDWPYWSGEMRRMLEELQRSR